MKVDSGATVILKEITNDETKKQDDEKASSEVDETERKDLSSSQSSTSGNTSPEQVEQPNTAKANEGLNGNLEDNKLIEEEAKILTDAVERSSNEAESSTANTTESKGSNESSPNLEQNIQTESPEVEAAGSSTQVDEDSTLEVSSQSTPSGSSSEEINPTTKDLQDELENSDQQLKDEKLKVQQLNTDLDAKKQEVQQLTDEIEKLRLSAFQIINLLQLNKNTEVQKLNTDLDAEKQKVQKLKEKKQALEGKGPACTAGVGLGLAAGLVAFTALERTVKLDIWVMVGIAVVSALAVGGITYAVLKPNTEVDGAKTQGVNGKGK